MKKHKKFKRAKRAFVSIHVITTVTLCVLIGLMSSFMEGQLSELRLDLAGKEAAISNAKHAIDSLSNQISILYEANNTSKTRTQQVAIGANIIRHTGRNIGNQKAVDIAKIIYDECEYSSSVDFAFVLAIIATESRFNTNAVSDAGAIGLGQIMPNTAASLAKQLGINYDNELLLDPKYNIKLSVKYLTNLKKSFPEYRFTAAAYNGGPGGAQKYMAYASGQAAEDTVHPQTLAYVKEVMKKFADYSAKLK